MQSSGAHLQILFFFLEVFLSCVFLEWLEQSVDWRCDVYASVKEICLKKKSSVEAQQAMRNQVIIDFFPPIKETEEMFFFETERHNVIDVDMLNLNIFESFSKLSEDMKSEFPLG